MRLQVSHRGCIFDCVVSRFSPFVPLALPLSSSPASFLLLRPHSFPPAFRRLSPLSSLMAAYPGQQPFQPGYASQPQQQQSPYQPGAEGAPGGPGGAYAVNRDDQLMEAFRAVCQKYEIGEFFARKLKQLEGWEIVLILDDSGSMNTPLKDQGGASAFARSITRWDELKNTVSIIVDIGAVMDKDGLDLYFLNRATMHHVTSSAQLQQVFAAHPTGLTPITPVLKHVLQEKKAVALEKNMLVIIATDGAPTNAQGEVDTAALKHVLVSERNIDKVCVTFLACTDDDSTIGYLNEWDNKIPRLDVCDDYHSERAEVLKAQGKLPRLGRPPCPPCPARSATHTVPVLCCRVSAAPRQGKISNLVLEVSTRAMREGDRTHAYAAGLHAHLPLR